MTKSVATHKKLQPDTHVATTNAAPAQTLLTPRIDHMRQLQQTMGNRAVAQFLKNHMATTAIQRTAVIQRALNKGSKTKLKAYEIEVSEVESWQKGQVTDKDVDKLISVFDQDQFEKILLLDSSFFVGAGTLASDAVRELFEQAKVRAFNKERQEAAAASSSVERVVHEKKSNVEKAQEKLTKLLDEQGLVYSAYSVSTIAKLSELVVNRDDEGLGIELESLRQAKLKQEKDAQDELKYTTWDSIPLVTKTPDQMTRAILRGTTGTNGASWFLNKTYDTSHDSHPEGFGAEYYLDASLGSPSWCVHVHRGKGGKLEAGSVKGKAWKYMSGVLNIKDISPAQLTAAGIPDNDTTKKDHKVSDTKGQYTYNA
jgi:ribosomal protein L20A (L18A)